MPFDQQMAVGEQTGDGQPDFRTLAENDLSGLLQNLIERLRSARVNRKFAF